MFVKMPDENRLVNFWVAPAIIGGSMLASAAVGALSGGNESSQSSQVNLEKPNQTEQALAGQFGSLFQPLMSFEDFSEWMSPYLEDALTRQAGVEYNNAKITNLEDAYSIYKAQPSKFTAYFSKKMREEGIPNWNQAPEVQSPQYDVGQSMADYQGQVQGAADKYTQGATQLWNDWMDFEDQYQDIYEAIAPAYQQVLGEYKQNLASVPQLNLGLPGGGSIPMAPKVHSNMYSQQANTQAGILGNQFGQQMQATSGMGQGIGNRQNLLSNYYNTQADAAQSNLAPVELAKWLLQSERNLRAGAPQTQTTGTQPTNVASTLLPAMAMAMPSLVNSSNSNAGQQAVLSNPNPQFNYNQNQYIPGAWG